MIKKYLNSWFEINEHEYLMYLLKGYDIEFSKEQVVWRLNNERHREDGPATIRRNGTKAWLINGKLHREDGPAIIWSDSSVEWWLNGKEYHTEAEFNKAIKQLV